MGVTWEEARMEMGLGGAAKNSGWSCLERSSPWVPVTVPSLCRAGCSRRFKVGVFMSLRI